MRKGLGIACLALVACLAAVGVARAQIPQLPQIPTLSIGVSEAEDPEQVALVLKIVILMTVLSLAPAILITLTSFARIVIVFGFLKQALGTGQMPPNQILIALALFLTFAIMGPVFRDIQTNAVEPFMSEQIDQNEAFDRAARPLHGFMLSQVREKDLELFLTIVHETPPAKAEDLSLRVLVPAFLTSELKTAFQIGFLLYIPFIVVDLVVASTLMSMGMMMLPPVFVSLPFKLLLFVLVDGWQLVVGSVVKSFG
ncbi:MAG: flagellar type III secretion system pore protein FliP [Myxococcales bacterium]|nr:flagellar type III secretion system pore protein FliP [Myxococcales bacterium]